MRKTENPLGVCRTWGVESENRPQRDQFLPDLQPNSRAIGQKDGEKWAAAVDLQPTIPKSDTLLAVAMRRHCLVPAAAVALLLGAALLHLNPARAAEPLVLTATGKDGTYLGKPSCWVTLRVTNPTNDEVTLFSSELRAVDAVSGKALETVSLPVVGIAGGKLAPQSVSKPWPLNVRETSCATVSVRFSKLLCVAGGRKCAPVVVKYEGVASITAPAQ